MLAVSRLTISDFRCYPHLRLDCDTRPMVLTGPNGAGKTNILEALSFLAPGRGLRRARISDVVRRDAAAGATWAVAAHVERPSGSGGGNAADVGTGQLAGKERRVVRIDGQPARTQSALSEVLSVLWLTPAMDRLFIEGAAGRRRFLDRLVLGQDPGHAQRAGSYDRALHERTRLLKEGRFDPAWLAALEDTMAKEGVAMATARNAAIARLNAACRSGIGPFPAASLTVSGAVESAVEERPDCEEWLRRSLAEARRRDAEAGGALIGPHRSDFVVRHADKDVLAEQCSTGEQKAVLVAIMLAQARIQAEGRGMPPILLLDEIAAHLDEVRRTALFDELAALKAQSWLTGTDESLFAPMGDRGQFFRVSEARVERASGP